MKMPIQQATEIGRSLARIRSLLNRYCDLMAEGVRISRETLESGMSKEDGILRALIHDADAFQRLNEELKRRGFLSCAELEKAIQNN